MAGILKGQAGSPIEFEVNPTVGGQEIYHTGNLNPVTIDTAQTLLGIKTFKSLRESSTEYTTADNILTINNGNLHVWNVSGNSIVTDSLTEGDAITMNILGTNFSITWPVGIKWVGGSTPSISDTGSTVIELFKLNNTLCGALVGYIT